MLLSPQRPDPTYRGVRETSEASRRTRRSTADATAPCLGLGLAVSFGSTERTTCKPQKSQDQLISTYREIRLKEDGLGECNRLFRRNWVRPSAGLPEGRKVVVWRQFVEPAVEVTLPCVVQVANGQEGSSRGALGRGQIDAIRANGDDEDTFAGVGEKRFQQVGQLGVAIGDVHGILVAQGDKDPIEGGQRPIDVAGLLGQRRVAQSVGFDDVLEAGQIAQGQHAAVLVVVEAGA
ncbi:unnamed protein product [Protopolystoma xenopodis]|uniref:Uncharacterized protein n=1 Tax=Protopolystoma xenopodis TaxID=117903 RepID=A0A448WZ38_9PLAT|nr:unnamed protein product [Protopolystoma xenopodis]